MSLPGWVRPGAGCVCIDDAWKDIFETGSPGPFPKVEEKFVIAGSHEVDGVGYLILASGNVAPDFYAVTGFRPMTQAEQEEMQLERDTRRFSIMLKDAGASAPREPVLA